RLVSVLRRPHFRAVMAGIARGAPDIAITAWRHVWQPLPEVYMSRSLTAFALALVLPLAACSDDDDPSGPDVEASGTYALASVNGEALPYTLLVSEGDSVEVVDGHIELNVDHTFTDSTTFRITEGGTITSEVEVYT